MGKYAFKNNTNDKTLEITIEGLFTQQDGMDYIKTYQDTIKRISTAEYKLIFDCTNLSVTPSEIVPMLQGCFEMYKQANYNAVKAIVPKQNGAVLKMQFSRLAKNAGLQNFEIIA